MQQRAGKERRTRLASGGAVAALVAALAAAWLAAPAPPARAVPHAVTPRPSPFDPDWLQVKLILDQKCAGCHRPNSERRDLTSYEAVLSAVDGQSLVRPGRPDESLLWEYVAWNVNADGGSDLPDAPLMPADKHEWLSDGQLTALRRWIENGALQYCLPAQCDIRPLLETDFPSARQCKQCHPRQYDEWSRSMHAYAQSSPVFEAFNLTLVERTGGTIGTFCTRCHTPLGTALGENESVRNVHRSRLSMEGVTCVVCHRRAQGHYKANGRVSIAPGDVATTCMYGPFESPASARAGAHPSRQLPYLKSSQFCGECHDVISPQGVRLEEAFSEWNNSPAARQDVSCQLCHMGPVQGRAVPRSHWPQGRAAEVDGVPPEELPVRRVSDHTFAGPDYSLLPDTEFPRKLDWMYEVDYRDPSLLTPYQQRTLHELRLENRASLEEAREKRYELLQHAARLHVQCPQRARGGGTLRLRVDVESTTMGHHVPTGFTAERQLWVSLEVRDQQGRMLYQSGDFDVNGDLRDGHSYYVLSGEESIDHQLMNFQNKFLAQTSKGSERGVAIPVNRNLLPLNVVRPARGIAQSFGRPFTFRVGKSSLPPMRTIGRTYSAPLPDRGACVVTARLNFRHLPPHLLDHVGTPHLKHLLETVVIDQRRIVVHVDH